jgi:hypothetical protein
MLIWSVCFFFSSSSSSSSLIFLDDHAHFFFPFECGDERLYVVVMVIEEMGFNVIAPSNFVVLCGILKPHNHKWAIQKELSLHFIVHLSYTHISLSY